MAGHTESCNLILLVKVIDISGQVQIGQPVGINRHKHVITIKIFLNRLQTLTDVRLQTGIRGKR